MCMANTHSGDWVALWRLQKCIKLRSSHWPPGYTVETWTCNTVSCLYKGKRLIQGNKNTMIFRFRLSCPDGNIIMNITLPNCQQLALNPPQWTFTAQTRGWCPSSHSTLKKKANKNISPKNYLSQWLLLANVRWAVQNSNLSRRGQDEACLCVCVYVTFNQPASGCCFFFFYNSNSKSVANTTNTVGAWHCQQI